MALPAAHWISGSMITAAVSCACSASQSPSEAAAPSATSAGVSPGAACLASGLGTVAAMRTSGA